jgi:hypothetical protein
MGMVLQVAGMVRDNYTCGATCVEPYMWRWHPGLERLNIGVQTLNTGPCKNCQTGKVKENKYTYEVFYVNPNHCLSECNMWLASGAVYIVLVVHPLNIDL